MDLDINPIDQKKDRQGKITQTSLLMNSSPARPDLLEANFYRHLNECKSIITFLGSFTSYEVIREELNKHINNLISSGNES